MLGKQSQEQDLFCYVQLENMVPQDHLLRKIKAEIDFSFIDKLAEPLYSDKGRPSIVPQVLVRMLLIGYLYGINGERRLCREVHLNIAYRLSRIILVVQVFYSLDELASASAAWFHLSLSKLAFSRATDSVIGNRSKRMKAGTKARSGVKARTAIMVSNTPGAWSAACFILKPDHAVSNPEMAKKDRFKDDFRIQVLSSDAKVNRRPEFASVWI